MAPAIVHFLVGASLALLTAVILAGRRPAVFRYRLWVVLFGGVWGLFPDAYRLAPWHTDVLHAFHRSRWADLFALHRTLDAEFVRNLGNRASLYAILIFSFTLLVVELAVRARAGSDRGPRYRPGVR